jgi:hypothetical protein
MNFDDGKKKKSNNSSGPRAKVCYICGKQTLIHGYQHHIEQCCKLFLQREELKPPKERRKLPPDPFSMIASSKGKSLDEMNKLAIQAFNDGGGMSKCLNCGRSFLPEKLPIHNKSCTTSNPARRIDENVNRRLGGNTTISGNSSSSSGGGDYDNNDNISPRVKSSRGGGPSSSIPEFIPLDMTQCIDCGRSFNEIAYER